MYCYVIFHYLLIIDVFVFLFLLINVREFGESINHYHLVIIWFWCLTYVSSILLPGESLNP